MASLIIQVPEATEFHEEISGKIYEKLKKRISEGRFRIQSKSKLKTILVIMEYIEGYEYLSGRDKKIIVKQVAHTAFSDYLESDIEDEELSETIDTLVAVSLGVYMVNKTFPRLKSKIKKCFKKNCNCC